jgi:DNA helicase II / ATP-dependent DNA helicase PcrA
MAWDDGVAGPLRDVAGSMGARIGVLAGPGTGKTKFGLMRRVVRLLEEGVPGSRILLLSFTRVAAADLRDKVAQLEVPGIDEVRATTLHSYCFGLLRRDAVLAITGRNPRVLLSHEVDLLLRDIGGDFGTIHERRRLLEAFVAGWARGVEDHPGLAGAPEDREFEHAVMRWLREHRAMLIGEVVPEAYRYLANNPAAEELSAFDHLVVDEYQDLNLLEQRLLDTLATDAALCVAGDDDQSIYSVRYANPQGIRSFLDRDDVEPYSIQVCGRCPSTVLAMANSLISQAPGRHKPDLTPLGDAEPGTVAIVQWPDVDAEIDGVVSAIAADVGSERREPGEILVLTNWRRIGERIRVRLAELEIAVRSFFTEEELAGDDAREALALLRLVVDPDDAPAVRVLAGVGDATGRSEAYQRLLAACGDEGQTPAQVLARLHDGEKIGVVVPALVQRFGHAMAKAAQLRALELGDLVDALLPEDRETTADLRATSLDALVEAPDARSLLDALVAAITQDDVPQNPDFVRVMSLHKSKGLTSAAVFVVGSVDGVVPTVRSDEPNAVAHAIEEGRRLFYVAVTRAADELVISGAVSMDLADAMARGVRFDKRSVRRVGDRHTVRTIASPYLGELGPSAPKSQKGTDWLGAR